MRNRVASSSSPTQFGLIAWLEQTRVVLPLKAVECRFAVCGDLLNVEIDQLFHQNNPQPLDCLYTFPLPAGAAVYRCEMHVNGRVIRAQVEGQERAREIVREKKAAGHRTALVEMERHNLFTLSLGNLQPEDVVIIRFANFQSLTRLEDWTSFNIPFCLGIRYIPVTPLLRSPSGRSTVDDTNQVPDASRISPPRMDRLHPDAAYLTVEGTIDGTLGMVRDVSSPTHSALVQDKDQRFSVSLADGAALPDRDLVVRWTEVPGKELTPVGWVWPGEKESFALVRLTAPSDTSVNDDCEQDVYFLLDRSGSMEGLNWEKTAQAFREFLKALGPKDRVWLTLFESEYRDFAEKPLPATELLQDPQVKNLEALGTRGGTELLPAVTHVLEKIAQHSAGRTVSLLLITDRQVGNEKEILRKLRAHSTLRVHTFGIDTAVNDGFLKQMASQQRGTSHLVTPNDDIVGTVARLARRLRRLVLTSVRVQGEWELADQQFPDLHPGEVFSVALRGATSAREVILEGTLPDGTSRTYRFDLQERPEPAVRLLWAKRRMDHCLARDEKAEAIRLAKEHNLICKGTAFVAWDQAERVVVSNLELYQPSMDPGNDQVRFKKCFRANRSGDLSDGQSFPARRPRFIGSIRGRTDLPAGYAHATMASELSDPAQFLLKMLSRKTGVELNDVSPLLMHDTSTSMAEINHKPSDCAPLTEALCFVLCEWVLSKPEDLEARWNQVKQLLAILRTLPFNDPTRTLIVQGWLEGNLKGQGDYYDRALQAKG